jgi:NADH dehydrogenase
MILVAGATGELGRAICRRLTQQGGTVYGMVRASSAPAAIAELESIGVRPVQADLADPPSLQEACSGCDAVISGITAMGRPAESIDAVDRDGQLALVAAAAAEGVERFVYVSYSGAIGKDDPLTLAKRAVERTLKHSGMGWTVLRPSYFMESWLSPMLGFDVAGGRVRIFGEGRAPISWVARDDVAGFAAAAVDSEEARNATLEIGGPEAIAPLDVVALCAELAGRELEVEHVAESVLQEQAKRAGSPQERSLAALMLAYARGNAVPMEDMAERFGLEPTPLRGWLQGTLGSPD